MHASRLRRLAHLLAETDVYAGFAQLALEEDYCRPELVDGGIIPEPGFQQQSATQKHLGADAEDSHGNCGAEGEWGGSNELTIVEGRHPVVEQVCARIRIFFN